MSNSNQRNGHAPKGATDLVAAVPIAALVVLSGLLVSIYSVVVHSFTARGTAEDCLKKAALYCAARLSSVSVEDSLYGRVGLVDQVGSVNKPNTVSMNSIYATLRLDHLIAKDLNLDCMDRLVLADLGRARMLDQRLRNAVLRAMSAGDEDNENSIAKGASDIMLRGQDAARLMSCKVRLGTTLPAQFTAGVPYTGDRDSKLVLEGQYRAGMNIAIADNQVASLYQLAPTTQLCNERAFRETDAGVTPSMVLVEVVYSGEGKQGQVGVSHAMSSCAVVGGAAGAPAHTALMLSFPHGRPGSLNSIAALLNQKINPKGNWQKAVGGAVPGKGQLVPTAESFELLMDEAMQECFYHWLRSQGTQPNLAQVRRVVRDDFSLVALRPDADAAAAPSINSALVKETGARTFAFLHQSSEVGSGQPALRSAFSGAPALPSLPPSAFPLTVDASGHCQIATRKTFDRMLVQDFLNAVYATNLAAIETQAIARSVLERMNLALKEMEKETFLTTEELNSVSSRLGQAMSSAGQQSGNAVARMRRSQSELTAAITAIKNKQQEYRRVKKRAADILMNAEYAARATFDLNSHMIDFGRKGVFYTQRPSGFLLRDNIVFVPKIEPAAEDFIYGKTGEKDDPTSWASDHFNVMMNVTQQTAVEGIPLEKLDSLHSNQAAAPRFVIFDSMQLKGGSPAPIELAHTPFGDSGITEGQLAYYSSNGVFTGLNPQVGWSVLARDLVLGFGLRKDATVASSLKWCNEDELAASNCPNLAVEIQVRSPVPVLPDLPVGSSLTNPSTHDHVFQIPPMPVSML